MPVTTLATTVSSAAARRRALPKVVISCPTALVTLPNTSPTVEYLDLGTWQWKELPRTGTTSLLRRSGVSRARIRLTATLRKYGNSSTPETQMVWLARIASQGSPVTVAYGAWISRLKWVINGSPMVTSTRLWEGSNKIMHADVTIELIQWVEEGVVKPAAAKKPAATHSKSGKKRTRKYTVRRGDTLIGIATKLTGHASNYRQIAVDNHIRNPNKIKVGQVLTITM